MNSVSLLTELAMRRGWRWKSVSRGRVFALSDDGNVCCCLTFKTDISIVELPRLAEPEQEQIAWSWAA